MTGSQSGKATATAADGFIDAYAVLGVSPTATGQELRSAHRRLVRRHHPDLAAPEDRAAATRRAQEINVAYGLVHDPGSRATYDRIRSATLARARAQQAAAGARRATAAVDTDLARRWEEALAGAGRWASRFWRQRRRTLARAQLRVLRAGADLLGRLLWLGWVGIGAAAGYGVALAAHELVGGSGGGFGPLAGLVGGAVAGSARGWRTRLRLAGLDPRAGRWVPHLALALLAVTAGVTLDAWLRS